MLTREDFTADEWQARGLSYDDVMEAVSEASGFQVHLIKNHRRYNQHLVETRWLVVWLMWHIFPDASTPKVGRAINRHHGAVTYALKKIKPRLGNDDRLKGIATEAVAILKRNNPKAKPKTKAKEAPKPPEPAPKPVAATDPYKYKKPQPKKYDIKMRNCLKCRGKFTSEWAGNRLCKHCKNGQEWRADYQLEPYSMPRKLQVGMR
jgi:hypothetical protein